MEQIQYTPYDSAKSYKPVATPNLIPEIEREAQRQSEADRAAFEQLQRNNAKRVENSKLAGQDLISLAKFSKTIASEVGKIYKRNEDEKAVNEVYESIVGGVPENVATAEAEDIAATDAEAEEVNATATAVEQETGDVAAGAVIRQDHGQNAQAQVSSRADLIAARAEYPTYMASWLESDEIISVNGENMTVAQAVATGDPRIIQSVVALGRNKFFRERGVAGARKLDVVRILGSTVLQTDAEAGARATRAAVTKQREQALEDLSANTYDTASNMVDGQEQESWSILSEQYWQSGLFATRADANEQLVKDLVEGMIDAGDVESIRNLRNVLKTGEKGTELSKQYGNILNDAERTALQIREGNQRQEVIDIEADMYEQLNGVSDPAQRAAIVEEGAKRLEAAGRHKEARELRTNQQALTVDGAATRNAAVLSDQVRIGEVVSAKPIEDAYARGEITQQARDTLLAQLSQRQGGQTPTNKDAAKVGKDYTERFVSDFLPLAGLRLDQNGNPIDPRLGETPLVTAGGARVIKGAIERELNIVLNGVVAANPNASATELNVLLQQAAQEWYKNNVLNADGRYNLDKLQATSGVSGSGKYGDQRKYWNDLVNSPVLLGTVGSLATSSIPRDFTRQPLSEVNASEFNPVRGDRIYHQESIESFAEQYKKTGQFPPSLVDMADTLGITPLALLQQQLGAYFLEPVVPNTSVSSGVDVTTSLQGAQVLMSLGFPAPGAAFISGNISQESSWNGQRSWGEVMNDGSDRNGGLVSWMDDAQKNHYRLRRIEERLGVSINQATDEQQLNAMIWEMKTYYPEAYKIFMNPRATERQLIYASRMYWGYGHEGSRYTTARTVQTQLS